MPKIMKAHAVQIGASPGRIPRVVDIARLKRAANMSLLEAKPGFLAAA